MSQFSMFNTEIIHNLQQLIHQPAARRSVAFAGSGVGFTIVELLIVIVVIGILAAIVIVAYNGIQNQAHDTTVKGDLSAIIKKLELYKIESPTEQYPVNETQLDNAKLKLTQGSYLERNNVYYCVSNDAQHYAMGAYTKGSTRYWVVDGMVTQTSDNVNGGATCSQLTPHPQPTTATAYGYHSDDNDWRDWTE